MSADKHNPVLIPTTAFGDYSEIPEGGVRK